MANFVRVCRRDEVPEGTGRTVEIGGKQIALFNAGGKFYAIGNVCLHRQGPLGEGDLEGTIVTCPWHGWQYDVTTGCNTDEPSRKVACFAVRVDGDEVLIEA